MDLERPPDIVVVAGGAPVDASLVHAVPTSVHIVAADSGLELARSLDWSVDVLVGDLDSLDPSLVAMADELAGEVRRHPVDKDFSDLELALAVAVERGPARVLVVGLEGGRPDHALANLLVAASPDFAELDLELVLDRGRAWVVHSHLAGRQEAGRTISILPVHGPAEVSVSGVRWPLVGEVLNPGSTRGLSNETTGGAFELHVHAGTVLCILPRT